MAQNYIELDLLIILNLSLKITLELSLFGKVLFIYKYRSSFTQDKGTRSFLGLDDRLLGRFVSFDPAFRLPS